MATIYNIGFPDARSKETDPIEQGASFLMPFTVPNVFSNAGVGCLVRGGLRQTYDSADFIPFKVEITSTTADLIEGLIELTPTTSASMTPGEYVYDVEIEDAGGFVMKLVKGKALVAPEVTKASL